MLYAAYLKDLFNMGCPINDLAIRQACVLSSHQASKPSRLPIPKHNSMETDEHCYLGRLWMCYSTLWV